MVGFVTVCGANWLGLHVMVEMLIHLGWMSSSWRWAWHRLLLLKKVEVFAGKRKMGFMKDAKEEGFVGNSLRMWKRERRALRQKEARANWKIKMEKSKWKDLTSTIWDQAVNIWSCAACSSRFLLYFHPHLSNCWIVSRTLLSSTSFPMLLAWV